MEQTDETVMMGVREGNVRMLGILFERYHGPLFQFFCRMTGNRTSADDLVQDVFFRILKYRKTFRDDSRFRTWMFHIARNARLDHFRKHDVDIPVPDTALDRPGDEPIPLDQLVRDQTNALLNRALLELSADNRELLVLARYQELQYSEISELLGVEVGVVKVRVHRAVKELRELFLKLSSEKKSWTVKNSETSLRTI